MPQDINNNVKKISKEEIAELRAKGEEFDIIIEETDDGVNVLLSRDNEICGIIAKELNPHDQGTFECFLNSKLEAIDGENHQSFCG